MAQKSQTLQAKRVRKNETFVVCVFGCVIVCKCLLVRLGAAKKVSYFFLLGFFENLIKIIATLWHIFNFSP